MDSIHALRDARRETEDFAAEIAADSRGEPAADAAAERGESTAKGVERCDRDEILRDAILALSPA